MKTYQSYSLNNYRQIPQVENLSSELKTAIEVVGNVLPFKTNNYVVDELINWQNVPNDPMFILTFPQREMLQPEHYSLMATALGNLSTRAEINEIATIAS